jgi:hypothetical protein
VRRQCPYFQALAFGIPAIGINNQSLHLQHAELVVVALSCIEVCQDLRIRTNWPTMTLTVVVGSSGSGAFAHYLPVGRLSPRTLSAHICHRNGIAVCMHSGKTTFLNDTNNMHKCTYVRQYHKLRPYIRVSQIPNFDPNRLPFWNIYENGGKAEMVQVGGTMSGEFVGTNTGCSVAVFASFESQNLTHLLVLSNQLINPAGLSGGQRKLLIFEVICQRTQCQSDLLLVFDEPFAGVTDDFVPFIVTRYTEQQLSWWQMMILRKQSTVCLQQ